MLDFGFWVFAILVSAFVFAVIAAAVIDFLPAATAAVDLLFAVTVDDLVAVEDVLVFFTLFFNEMTLADPSPSRLMRKDLSCWTEPKSRPRALAS
jgi:hypothetical protein